MSNDEKEGILMRFRLKFSLKKPEIATDYRRIFLHFLKQSLSSAGEEVFETYYQGETPIQKDFTFAIRLPNPRFEGDIIALAKPELEMNFATCNTKTGLVFYNAFVSHRGVVYSLSNDNGMVLKDVILPVEKKVIDDHVDIIFQSPLVVRQHRGVGDDYYLSFRHGDEFRNQLAVAISSQCKGIPVITDKMTAEFSIEPLAPRKLVVSHYGQHIECSIGKYRLGGNPLLLEVLYQAGMGSRRSSGFGMFDILT